MSTLEASRSFRCFGARASVHVGGAGGAEAAAAAERALLEWHDRFTRFTTDSELSRLNADPRVTVPASEAMLDFIAAAANAWRTSDGLVDATVLGALEDAGYVASREWPAAAQAQFMHRSRRPAGPRPDAAWPHITIDRAAGTVTRPPGVRFDGGGLVKGLAADAVAATLASRPTFAVECAGDLRIGGTARVARQVGVADPVGDTHLHALGVIDGAVATSGVTRRAWRRADGRPAHHLIDPATGEPAWTGVLQATALAPTALEAEVLAKAALLSGSELAHARLIHGGVVVTSERAIEIVPARRARLAA